MKAATFDHLEVVRTLEPYADLNELRERCPVFHSEKYGGFWVVTTAEDVRQAAQDTATFSSAHGVTIPAFEVPWTFLPVEVDPPAVADYRRILVKRTSPKAVSELEPRIREILVHRFEQFRGRGHADLAHDLLVPAMALALAHFLGLPEDDRWPKWGTQLISLTPDSATFPEIMNFFDELYEDRTDRPQDDFPTDMLQVEVNGRRLDRQEWLGIMGAMFFGGFETTANSAAHILIYLYQHPSIRQELLDNPATLAGAIEELMRLVSPSPHMTRTATRDVTVGDQRICRGERVMLEWMTANRDPAEFPQPDAFDLDRPNISRHFAYGYGVHKCIGMHLARLELRVILEEVLARMPDYEVILDEVELYPAVTRGVAKLPVRFPPF